MTDGNLLHCCLVTYFQAVFPLLTRERLFTLPKCILLLFCPNERMTSVKPRLFSQNPSSLLPLKESQVFRRTRENERGVESLKPKEHRELDPLSEVKFSEWKLMNVILEKNLFAIMINVNDSFMMHVWNNPPRGQRGSSWRDGRGICPRVPHDALLLCPHPEAPESSCGKPAAY